MSAIKILVVPVDGSPHIAEVFNELRSFQSFVGGYVEPVRMMSHLALVDEEGLQKRKPRNATASAILGKNIVGDVIFLGDDGGSEFVDVPNETVEAVLGVDGKVIESFQDPIAAAVMTLRSNGYQVIAPREAPPRVRTGAPDTSKAIEPKINSRMGEVYEFIKIHQPCSDDEIEQWTNITHQSASAARRHLVLRGLVVDSGLRHRTRYGNACIAWVTPDRFAEFAPRPAL